jgi:cyclic pyranopterin phosphate synthase
MQNNGLTHIDGNQKARMVNVGNKPDTERTAIAGGEIVLKKETINLIQQNQIKKGDVLTVAKLAGIMAAKKTSELIPLCHLIPIHEIDVKLVINPLLPGVEITSTIKSTSKTGVEMEALTAVAVSALTIYDMIKAVEKSAKIQNIRLVEKHGGLSGDIFNE